MNGTATHKPTSKQFDYIRILLAEIEALDADIAATWKTELNTARDRGQFDIEAASEAIEDLKQSKRNLQRKSNKLDIPDVPEGRYAVEIDGTLKFYSVNVSDSGFVTANVWASDEQHRLEFRAMVGVLKAIETAGVLECLLAFGREIGVCGKCGRTLTSEWRKRGIGPVCAKRQGLA